MPLAACTGTEPTGSKGAREAWRGASLSLGKANRIRELDKNTAKSTDVPNSELPVWKLHTKMRDEVTSGEKSTELF